VRKAGLLAALLTALGCLVSVGPLAAPGAACSCVQPDAAMSFTNADVVFVGTALTEAVNAQPFPGVQQFDVLRVTKGSPKLQPSGTLQVAGNVSCGPTLSEAGTQIVYAVNEPLVVAGGMVEADLSVLACSASRTLTEPEIRSLRVSTALPPSPVTRVPTPDDPAGVDGPLALLTLATVGGAVGFLLIVRRHKRRMRAARRQAPRRR